MSPDKKPPSPQVRVEFKEARTQDLILVRHIDAAELPESFALHTEIDLGLGMWRVEHAAPSTREEFASTGELELFIARVDVVHTEQGSAPATPEYEVLFAPQSQHHLPPMSTPPKERDELDLLYLYEEDWLTNQLLPATKRSAIKKEFGLIARTPVGMTHRLDDSPTDHAVSLPCTLVELADALDAGFFDGVLLCRHRLEGLVDEGFALESSLGTIFYGHALRGTSLITLGVHDWESTDALLEDLARIASIAHIGEEALLFVSWNSQSMLTLSEAIRSLTP